MVATARQEYRAAKGGAADPSLAHQCSQSSVALYIAEAPFLQNPAKINLMPGTRLSFYDAALLFPILLFSKGKGRVLVFFTSSESNSL